MRKEDMLVVDVGRQPKVDGAEKLSTLSWLCRHAGQIAKGGIAVIGLLAVGGIVGYFFGRKQSSADSSSNALAVSADSSSALTSSVIPTDLVSDTVFHDAEKPLEMVRFAQTVDDAEKVAFGAEKITCPIGMILGGATGNPLLFTIGMLNCFTSAEALLKIIDVLPPKSIRIGQSVSVSFNLSTIFADTNDPGGEHMEISVTRGDGSAFPSWMNCSSSDSYQLTRLYSLPLYHANVRDITTAVNNRLYAVTAEDTLPANGYLVTLDVSVPSMPYEVTALSLGERGESGVIDAAVSKIYIAGSKSLFVADLNGTLKAFPALSGQSYRDIALANNIIYLGGSGYSSNLWTEYLYMFNVQNPAEPAFIGKYQGLSGPNPLSFNFVTLSGNGKMYLTDNNNLLLRIMDVTNFTTPRLLANYNMSTISTSHIPAADDILYLPAVNKLQILNMANPTTPFLINQYQASGASIYAALLEGKKLFLLTDGGPNHGCLEVVDVTNLQSLPLLCRWESPTYMGGFSNLGMRITKNKNILFSQYRGGSSGSGGVLTFQLQCSKMLSLSGMPTQSDGGNTLVKLTATNPMGESASTDFTIRVEAPPKNMKSIPGQYAAIGYLFSYSLDQNVFVDPNNDLLTYRATFSEGVALPDWLSFNAISGLFLGTPQDQHKGIYNVTIVADDRISGTAATSFMLTVAHKPQIQTAIANRVTIVQRSFSFSIPKDAFVDLDGDALTYNVSSANGGNLPSWLSFDSAGMKLFGRSSLDNLGITGIRVTASNHKGAESSTFYLNVLQNTPPKAASSISTQHATAGQAFLFVLGDHAFIDSDGDVLKYSADLQDAADWLKFNASEVVFSGTPSSLTDASIYAVRKYTIIVTAQDTSNSTAQVTFGIYLHGPSFWENFITAGITTLGILTTAYGYAQKKYLLWDFFKKGEYRKPVELLTVGDTAFSHEINFPAEHIKSIIVTTSRDRSCVRKIAPCCKKTLGFFPMLEGAVSDVEVRTFLYGGTKAELFSWLLYDPEENVLKSVKGGPTAEFTGEDIKIQIRGTDNRIMEEFHIKVGSQRYELEDVALGTRMKTIHRKTTPLHIVERQVTTELKQPLMA